MRLIDADRLITILNHEIESNQNVINEKIEHGLKYKDELDNIAMCSYALHLICKAPTVIDAEEYGSSASAMIDAYQQGWSDAEAFLQSI